MFQRSTHLSHTNKGLDSLEKALDNMPDRPVPTSFLLKLMRYVLTMNTFVWDGKLYTQTHGTAIGTRSAPTFCGIFMGGMDERMLELWLTLGPDCWPEDWLRCIDDVCSGGVALLGRF